MAGAKQEVEIKFTLVDEDELRQRLASAGAISRGTVDEENYFCDFADKSLSAGGRILRLRQSRDAAGRGDATLTYKEPVDDPRFKVRDEIEVSLGDLDSARLIFEKLGFHCRLGYRKRREMWDAGDVAVTLDTLAFGRFVELEGTPASISRLAQALGFDLAQGLTTSYLTLADQAAKVIVKGD